MVNTWWKTANYLWLRSAIWRDWRSTLTIRRESEEPRVLQERQANLIPHEISYYLCENTLEKVSIPHSQRGKLIAQFSTKFPYSPNPVQCTWPFNAACTNSENLSFGKLQASVESTRVHQRKRSWKEKNKIDEGKEKYPFF